MPEEQSYEAARAELRDIVAKLEAGGQPLEESLALWERGELLADVTPAAVAGLELAPGREVWLSVKETAVRSYAADPVTSFSM